MKRREFVHQTAAIGAMAVLNVSLSSSAEAEVNWPVGCFNRPWTKWSFDETLKQIKAAGYNSTGLLSWTREEPFIGAKATPECLEHLKKRMSVTGLVAYRGALPSRHNIPLEDSIGEVRKQIDNAKFLSLEYALSFGANNPEEFAHYYKVMSDAAGYAQDKGVKLAMKPHGGISGSAEEILRVIKEVNHRNFSIWYDAGNIIHYTGKDPVAEIEPIARHITGFCAKDCGEMKGDVMIQFGAGKVDFAGVFKKLEAGGFNGPVMVECCKVGATPEETTSNARANREFLEKILASL